MFWGLCVLLFAPWLLLGVVPAMSKLWCRVVGCDWRVMNLPDGPGARCMRCGRQERMVVERA